MTDIIKRASQTDLPSLAELSDRVFRPDLPAGTAMGVEFAPLFSPDNAHNLYFVEQDNKPVSLVGMMPGHAHVHGVAVSTASMGSVCTLADYRKHHFASQMVEQAIQDFSKTTSVLLVSGDLSIYRRVGCVNFGHWMEASLERTMDGNWGGETDFMDVQRVRTMPDLPAMLELYHAEPLHFSRSPAQFEALLTTMTAPRFRNQSRPPEMFAAYRRGELVAYAIALQADHRPESVRIFEWAGDRTALPRLATAARTHFGCETVHVTFSPSDRVMQSVLLSHGVPWTTARNQGTILVLNPSLLLDELGLLIEERYGARLELSLLEPDAWRVRWTGRNAENLPAQGKVLRGSTVVTVWLFDASGLGLPFPRTDDLSFV